MTEAKKQRMKRDQKICKMISAGKNVWAIAKECQCCCKTVINVAKANGLRLDPNQQSQPGKHKGYVLSILWSLLNSKETYREIAKRLNVSFQYIAFVAFKAREAGFKIRGK